MVLTTSGRREAFGLQRGEVQVDLDLALLAAIGIGIPAPGTVTSLGCE